MLFRYDTPNALEESMRSWFSLVVLALCLPAVAQAAILKFDDPVIPGGTVSYDGAGGAAIGDNILFQSIQGLGTPLNDGVTLVCDGCFLDFTTGVNLSEGPALWNFGPGGLISLIGAVPALGLPAGTLLLSGFFDGTPNEIASGTDGFGLFAALGTDSKNPTLATFFGLDPVGFTFATTSIQTAVTVGANGSFAGTVVNADLNNTQAVVPQAATGLLLTLGLLFLGIPSALRRFAA
jgi:hypothetical protein